MITACIQEHLGDARAPKDLVKYIAATILIQRRRPYEDDMECEKVFFPSVRRSGKKGVGVDEEAYQLKVRDAIASVHVADTELILDNGDGLHTYQKHQCKAAYSAPSEA